MLPASVLSAGPIAYSPISPTLATYGPLGTSLAAWLLVPIALYVIGLGLGLLVEKVTRARMPSGLLVPVGVCVAVALMMPGYRLGAGAWLAVLLVVGCALLGLVPARASLRARVRDESFTAIAGLLVYAIYIAPVVLAGGWTWTGYNFVNDTAVQFLLAQHAYHAGAAAVLGPPKAPPQSTSLEHIRVYLDTAYPLGLHSLTATLSWLLRLSVPAIYQSVISALAGLGAMALAWLVRQVIASRAWAVGIAVIALSANLTYNYALQGNAKEIGVLAALIVAAAAGRHALTAERPLSAIAVTALTMAAAISFYSSAAVPYCGCLALALLVAAFVQRSATLRRALVRGALLGAVVVVVASIATLVTVPTSARTLRGTFSVTNPQGEFGQLVRPLPLRETAGTWLIHDYRLAVEPRWSTVNNMVIILTVVLLIGAALWCVRRRETGWLLLIFAMALTLAILGPRVSPYAKAKMLALMSPAVVAGAGIGCAFLARQIWQPLGYLPAAVVTVGVLASNALIYHYVQLAPIDRMEAMSDIGRHYAHERQGMMLVDDMDEFAKVFMQPVHMNVALELITPLQFWNRLLTSYMPRNADLDQMPPQYLQLYPLIAQRRGPDASRAPWNYRLDYQNRYFNVWKQVAPARDVLAHIPLQSVWEGSAPAPCDAIRQLKKSAGADATLVASEAAREVELDVVKAAHPAGWKPSVYWPRTLEPHTPGHVDGFATFPAGTYEIWVNGSTGRRLTVSLDGRPVGSVLGVNTNGESLPGGTVRVSAGRHRITITRPSADLAPGNGYSGYIGPVFFEALPDKHRLLSTTNPRALCGKRLDWVEAIRAGSAGSAR